MTIIIFKLFNLFKDKKPQKRTEYITRANPKFGKIMKKIMEIKEKASKMINLPKADNQILEQALKQYTEAIDLKIKDKINAVLYSNRAWLNLKLERNGAALEDANKAIEWDPNFKKAYYRRGCANLSLLKYEDALTDFEDVYKDYPEELLKEKIDEIKLQLEKKNKNKKNDNDSACDNSSSELPPEILLDIKYIEDEIKKEEIKKNKNKDLEYTKENENDHGNIDSEHEPIKKPEYKDKLSLTKSWIVGEVIEAMKKKIFMSKLSLLKIILDVIKINMHEPSLIDIELKNKNFNICGDIHGQFYDLLKIFNEFGFPSETNPYLFNGDFVDRGSFSVECIITLLCFKLLYPKHFYLAREITKVEI